MSKLKRTSTSDPQSRSTDAGFSLVEVMVSLSLFTIVAVSSTVALVASAKYGESTDNRVVAASLAAAQISLARSAVDQAALAGGTTTIVRNGATFTVRREVGLTCLANKKHLITITVSWPGVGDPVHSDTVRAC